METTNNRFLFTMLLAITLIAFNKRASIIDIFAYKPKFKRGDCIHSKNYDLYKIIKSTKNGQYTAFSYLERPNIVYKEDTYEYEYTDKNYTKIECPESLSYDSSKYTWDE